MILTVYVAPHFGVVPVAASVGECFAVHMVVHAASHMKMLGVQEAVLCGVWEAPSCQTLVGGWAMTVAHLKK